ncbi:phosphoinositide phosphatase SAC8-like [Pyrus ussuriensis x Pyrus communis]|uniref:Phosphoinositide phosphatase SAC8-like n=1 Tax=Pyrus ussuriensis x Pyrus communis TaxID=2448454 RepID=A0A5N5HRP0_9ROSA|nr:phosphoinositide phosphatase SAC8-like [Pyrus ussuriensis x Pyrus communis]
MASHPRRPFLLSTRFSAFWPLEHSPNKTSTIYGVAGTIRLLTSSEKKCVLRYYCIGVFLVTIMFLCLNRTLAYIMHGDEGQLSTAFSAEMQNLPNVRYVSFDFQHVCGNSNFENLKSCLAQKSLDAQLQRTGVLDSSESISMFAEDYQTFRACDEISLDYAGTYALKGDLVREADIGGIINDGMSALSRYFLNNFQDGIRQYMSSVLCAGVTAGVAAAVKANGR